jgi:hypothetical protein
LSIIKQRLDELKKNIQDFRIYDSNYRTLSPEAAGGWLEDSRLEGTLAAELRDPWAS